MREIHQFWVLLRLVALCLGLLVLATGPEVRATEDNPSAPLFVIYAPLASQSFFLNDPVDLRGRVNRWRDLLRQRGARYRILTHPDQWAGVPASARIILPSGYALRDDERQLLLERMAAGASVLATGFPGARDGQGAWVGTAFAQSLSGTALPAEASAGEAEFAIVAGDTPLSYGLASGTRLWLGKAANDMRPAISQAQSAYLSDWAGRVVRGGALRYDSQGPTRRVWLAWPESAWDAQSPDFLAIARRALDWLEGRPFAYATSWPWPHRGAMTLGVSALGNVPSLPGVDHLLQSSQARASINVLTSELPAQAPVLQTMASQGHEIALLGDRWQVFAGQTVQTQTQRVAEAVRALRHAMPGQAFTGLRAPEGASDAATEVAVSGAGGSYLVDAGRFDSPQPVVSGTGVVILPSTLSLEGGVNVGAEQARSWGQSLELERARAERLSAYAYVGLEWGALSSASGASKMLADFLQQTQASGLLWVDSALRISQWWKQRQRVQVSTEAGPFTLKLTVRLADGDALTFPLGIVLGGPAGARARIVAASYPQAQLEPAPDGLQALVLAALPAGEHVFHLEFSPAP